MQLSGVHHVSLNVDDIDEAGRFYSEMLGMQILPRPDFGFPGLWLEAGGQQIHLIQVEEHAAPEGQHFALLVRDLDAALAELEDRGVEVSPAIEIPDVGRQAFLRDPSGNLIELNQPKR